MKSKLSTHIAFIAWIVFLTVVAVAMYSYHIYEFNLYMLGGFTIFGIADLFVISEYSGYIKDTTVFQIGSTASYYGPKGLLITGTIQENFGIFHKIRAIGHKDKWVLSHQVVWVRSS